MLLRFAFATAVAAAAAVAQNDYDYDKVTSGRLGSLLTMQVDGATPSGVILFLVSSNAGPTPLAAIDPGDLRIMQVGTDLLSVLGFGITSPAGTASNSLPLPNNPAISGIVLHWQTVMLTLSTPFFGQLGNAIVTQTGLQDSGVLAPATLVTARAFGASLVDADNNGGQGDVLVTGGGSGTLTSATGLASTEAWNFRRMTCSAGPTMTSSRALHLAVRLNDDRVLLIGGTNSAGVVLGSCELYDPATNSFTATGSMATPRVLHAACRMADGRVMVAGGTSTVMPDVVAALGATQSSVEIYNPATGTWSGANAIGGLRLAPALTLLSNSQVMVSGGVQVSVFLGLPIAAASTTAVQRWNPATGTWTAGANMAQARAGHHYNQVTLLDGRVLMSGGVNVPSLTGATTAAPIAGAELYSPASNTWATVNMPTARALHSANRLADGRVVACGGTQGTLLAPVPIANVDVFNPAANSWTPAPALLGPRASHAGELLPDGTLVLFGGQNATVTVNTIETLRF